jgi:hypothetical protein
MTGRGCADLSSRPVVVSFYHTVGKTVGGAALQDAQEDY